jgi:hypothetical protein
MPVQIFDILFPINQRVRIVLLVKFFQSVKIQRGKIIV